MARKDDELFEKLPNTGEELRQYLDSLRRENIRNREVLKYYPSIKKELETQIVQVKKIFDGDTILVEMQKKLQEDARTMSVRLAGIDTQETAIRRKTGFDFSEQGKPILDMLREGYDSTKALEELLKNQSVRLSNVDFDKYGRAVAYVSTQEIPDVGKRMLETGQAQVYNAFDHPRIEEYNKVKPEQKKVETFEKNYSEFTEKRVENIINTSQAIAGVNFKGILDKEITFLTPIERLVKILGPFETGGAVAAGQESFLKGEGIPKAIAEGLKTYVQDIVLDVSEAVSGTDIRGYTGIPYKKSYKDVLKAGGVEGRAAEWGGIALDIAGDPTSWGFSGPKKLISGGRELLEAGYKKFMPTELYDKIGKAFDWKWDLKKLGPDIADKFEKYATEFVFDPLQHVQGGYQQALDAFKAKLRTEFGVPIGQVSQGGVMNQGWLPGLHGTAYPEPVAMAYRNIVDKPAPDWTKTKPAQIYDAAQDFWKKYITGTFGAWYTRNELSGVSKNLLTGTSDVLSPSNWYRGAESLTGKTFDIKQISGQIVQVTGDTLKDFMTKFGVIGQKGALDVTGGIPGKITTAIEDHLRTTKFVDSFKQLVHEGETVADAAWKAAKETATAHYQYADEFMTKFERGLKYAIPFERFFAGNTKFWWNNLENVTQKLDIFSKFTDQRTSYQPDKNEPIWKRNMVTTFGIGGYGFDWEDATRTFGDTIKNITAILTPFAKSAGEIFALDWDTFKERPISTEQPNKVQKWIADAADKISTKLGDFIRDPRVAHATESFTSRPASVASGFPLSLITSIKDYEYTDAEKARFVRRQLKSPSFLQWQAERFGLSSADASDIVAGTQQSRLSIQEPISPTADQMDMFFGYKPMPKIAMPPTAPSYSPTQLSVSGTIGIQTSSEVGVKGAGTVTVEGAEKLQVPINYPKEQAEAWAKELNKKPEEYLTAAPMPELGSPTERARLDYIEKNWKLYEQRLLSTGVGSKDIVVEQTMRNLVEQIREVRVAQEARKTPEQIVELLKALVAEQKARSPMRYGQEVTFEEGEMPVTRKFRGDRRTAEFNDMLVDNLAKAMNRLNEEWRAALPLGRARIELEKSIGQQQIRSLERGEFPEVLKMINTLFPGGWEAYKKSFQAAIEIRAQKDMEDLARSIGDAGLKGVSEIATALPEGLHKQILKLDIEFNRWNISKEADLLRRESMDKYKEVVAGFRKAQEIYVQTDWFKNLEKEAETLRLTIKDNIAAATSQLKAMFARGEITGKEMDEQTLKKIQEGNQKLVDFYRGLAELAKKTPSGQEIEATIPGTKEKITLKGQEPAEWERKARVQEAQGEREYWKYYEDTEEREKKRRDWRTKYGAEVLSRKATLRTPTEAFWGQPISEETAEQKEALFYKTSGEMDIRKEDIYANYESREEAEKAYMEESELRWTEYQVTCTEIDRKAFEQRLNLTQGMFGDLSNLFQTFYEQSGKQVKAFFYIWKAAQLAEAIISGINATQEAYKKGMQLGGMPVAIAWAAISAAMTGARVGAILAQTFQEGGEVKGGSGVRDDVPILATGGEYVIQKAAVEKYGINFMATLNKGMLDVSEFSIPPVVDISIPKTAYQAGGLVMEKDVKPEKEEQKQLTITNIIDPALMQQYMATREGQQSILNVLSANSYIVKRILQ